MSATKRPLASHIWQDDGTFVCLNCGVRKVGSSDGPRGGFRWTYTFPDGRVVHTWIAERMPPCPAGSAA